MIAHILDDYNAHILDDYNAQRDPHATSAQRRYWWTPFARFPEWAAAFARARHHDLAAYPLPHRHSYQQRWRVCSAGVLTRCQPGRIYVVQATGLKYREVACSCPGARGGHVCMHMAVVAHDRALDAQFCLHD